MGQARNIYAICRVYRVKILYRAERMHWYSF